MSSSDGKVTGWATGTGTECRWRSSSAAGAAAAPAAGAAAGAEAWGVSALTSARANSIGISCISRVSSSSPTFSWNEVRTSGPSKPRPPPNASSRRSGISTCGAEMSTRWPTISAIAVAALPIIWFIASPTAEACSSPTSSDAAPSPPIIRSATTDASRVERMKMLRPDSPSVYSIVTRAAGPANSARTSSSETISTTGVVIWTGRCSRALSAVAALDMQMLPTSPTVSRSMSLRLSPRCGGRPRSRRPARPPRREPAPPQRGLGAGLAGDGLLRDDLLGGAVTGVGRGLGGAAVHQSVDLLLGEAAFAHANVLSRSSIEVVI